MSATPENALDLIENIDELNDETLEELTNGKGEDKDE